MVIQGSAKPHTLVQIQSVPPKKFLTKPSTKSILQSESTPMEENTVWVVYDCVGPFNVVIVGVYRDKETAESVAWGGGPHPSRYFPSLEAKLT